MIINEAEFSIPYKQLSTENHKDIHSFMVQNMDILQNTAYFRNVKTSDFCNNNLCFLVNARPFHNDLIIEQIKKHNVLQRILTGEIKLVIDASMETHRYHIDFVFDKLIKELGINPENILLVVSSKSYLDYIKSLSEKYKVNNINLEFFSHYEWLMKKQIYSEYLNKESLFNNNFVTWTDQETEIAEPVSPLIKSNFVKKYINLNRRWNTHRISLLCLLNSKNLLERGYNSFSSLPLDTHNGVGNYGNNRTDVKVWQKWIEKAKEDFNIGELESEFDIYKKLPLTVDTNYFDFNNAYSSQAFLARYMKNCMFQIITETFFNHENNVVCISEKTYRAIAHKQPFLIVGEHNSLSYLKDLGYKTFSPFINEEYDNVKDSKQRLQLITNEIERLCNLDIDQEKIFCKNLIEIVDYNYNLFKNRQNYVYRLL